jgi:NADPH:quinone reductase-like Zn-dependent oxidoreductase
LIYQKLQNNIKNLLGTQNVLVRAASSGIGSLAMIIFASLGFQVYGSCQTLEKADKLNQKLKAYPLKNISILAANQLAAYVNDKKIEFNLIFDMLGGNALAEAIQLAAPFAHIQHIAFLEKQTALLDLSLFLRKNLSLKASMLRPQEADIKIELVTEIERLLIPSLDFKSTPPFLNKQYEFRAAAIHLAHQTMLQNQHIGKCILSLD